MNSQEVADHVGRDLMGSGLPSDPPCYGFAPISGEDAALYLRVKDGQGPGPGMAIHYIDWTGGELLLPVPDSDEIHPYLRVKPVEAWHGAKYLSPCGLPNQLYIPEPSVLDLAIRLGYFVETEGEKKTAALFHNGFAAVGFAGPWGGFESGSTDLLTPLLEEGLSLLRPHAVRHILVWDSDAATNVDFARATQRYARLFAQRGMEIRCLVLPQTLLLKVGADDFIIENGVESMRTLLDAAPVVPAAGDYHDLQLSWLAGLAHVKPWKDHPQESAEWLRSVFSKGFCTDFTRQAQERLMGMLRDNGFHDAPLVLSQVVADEVWRQHQAHQEEELAAAEAAAGAPGRPRKPSTPVKLASNHLYSHGGDVVVSDSVGRTGGVDYAWVWDPLTDVRRVVLAASLAAAKSLRDERATRLVLRRRLWLPGGNQATLVSHAGAFYSLKDGRWLVHQGEESLRSLVQRELCSIPNLEKSMVSVETTMTSLRTHHVTHVAAEGGPAALWTGDGWSATPTQLVLANCRLEIMDDNRQPLAEPIAHELTPDFFHANPLPVVYDPGAGYPLWQSTLDLFTPNPEYQAFLQEVFGVLFLAETVKAMFLLLGTGSNGKGTFGHVATHLVGPGNQTSVTPEDIASRFEGLPLARASLNFLGDAPVGALDTQAKSTVMKLVTGGDPVHFNVKHSTTGFDRVVTAKIFMCFNSLQPSIADRTDGMRDRVVILPFHERIDPKAANPDVKRRLVEEELSGIFNWALAGLMRYLQSGRHFSPCRVVEEATAQFWADSEACVGFIRVCLEPHPNAHVLEDDIWRAFVGYCADRGVDPGSKKALFSRIIADVPGASESRLGGDVGGGTQRRTIRGIGLSHQQRPSHRWHG